uniref:Uncharacterized protein n=1 Tax=Oryza sativa subsp. japonica TaxID=39947 RepID=Q6ZCE1_ORYSJ|nr:hypothetical protein [Oryza sativa Japonica Group]
MSSSRIPVLPLANSRAHMCGAAAATTPPSTHRLRCSDPSRAIVVSPCTAAAGAPSLPAEPRHRRTAFADPPELNPLHARFGAARRAARMPRRHQIRRLITEPSQDPPCRRRPLLLVVEPPPFLPCCRHYSFTSSSRSCSSSSLSRRRRRRSSLLPLLHLVEPPPSLPCHRRVAAVARGGQREGFLLRVR